MIKLTDYIIKEIRYPDSIYKLGKAVSVYDEKSFYRIDGTYIFDKNKIKSMKLNGDKLTIHMNDMDVILTVKKK